MYMTNFIKITITTVVFVYWFMFVQYIEENFFSWLKYDIFYGAFLSHLYSFLWLSISLGGALLISKFIWKNNTNKNTLSNADELEKYSELRNKGIITEEEFASKKKKLLDL